MDFVAFAFEVINDGGAGLGAGVHVAGKKVEDGLPGGEVFRFRIEKKAGEGLAIEWMGGGIGPPLATGEFEAGGVEIEAVCCVIRDGACGDHAGPAGDERNADAAFSQHALFPL